MILKKVTLQNIRSYKDPTEIEIPEGRTLFQGDIGCGKSTILSAIEFALFGLGDIDGNHLLRSGQNKGSVLLEFQVNGKSYQAYRSLLRRGKNIIQDQGHVIDGDITTAYPVGEMKTKILEIININEKSQTRTTSLIYRFAIFTPQEMMKQILAETKERRLEILRRAFSIEEYSTAKKNTSIILSWIREQINIANEITSDLPEREIHLDEEKNKRDILSKEINKMSEVISGLDAKKYILQKERGDLQETKDLVIQLEATIPHLRNAISKSQALMDNLQNLLEQSKEDIRAIEESEQILKELRPYYEDYTTKKEKLSTLEESILYFERLDKEKTKLEQSIEDEKRYLKIGINKLKKEVSEGKQELGKGKESLKELNLLEQEEANLKENLKQLPTLRKAVTAILTHLSEYNTIMIAKTDEIRRKRKEIEEIVNMGDGAKCPQCKQKLTKEHISRVKNEFKQEKSAMEEQVRELREQINHHKRKKEQDQNKIADLESEEEQLKKLGKRLGKLIEKNETTETAFIKLKEKEKELHEDINLLEQERYAIDERNKLASVLKNLKELSMDRVLYIDLKQHITKYENRKIESEYIANLQEVKRKPKVQDKIKDTKTSIDNLDEEISSTAKTLYEKQILYDKNIQLRHQLIKLDEEAEKLEYDFSKRKQELAGKYAEIKSMGTYLKDLEVDVGKKRDYFRLKQIFQQMQNWLDECFIPIIESLEKYVLQSINEEFNHLFQKWFNTLIETEDIIVEVDEDFTPIITQAGYSLDVNSLSGGEKTSVALAYRLALNTMIRKIADMDTSLLILDEPTDGFGKEQLIRLREVLDDLNRAQIIMVSYERELESFVDRIYRITKEGNISRLELIQA